MDRYLKTDTGLSAEDQRVLMNIKNRNYDTGPALPNDEIKPSERAKRRRLTLLKKHSLVY